MILLTIVTWFGLYLAGIIEVFSRHFTFKYSDASMFLDRYVLLSFLGYAVLILGAYVFRKRLELSRFMVFFAMIVMAVMIVGGYYFLIPRALVLSGWVEVRV